MQCAKCGCPMEYSTLLDSINRKAHRLFYCYHCLWQINEVIVLETLATIYQDSRFGSFGNGVDNVTPNEIV